MSALSGKGIGVFAWSGCPCRSVRVRVLTLADCGYHCGKILLLGKVNDTLQDLHAYLSGAFRVQLSTENTEVLSGMIRVFQPDLVLISLVGAYDFGSSVFRHLSVAHSGLPVLTIGTEKEREAFLKYYEDEQFENLIRPVENRAVYEESFAIYKEIQQAMEKIYSHW